jgi:hypothetical protein
MDTQESITPLQNEMEEINESVVSAPSKKISFIAPLFVLTALLVISVVGIQFLKNSKMLAPFIPGISNDAPSPTPAPSTIPDKVVHEFINVTSQAPITFKVPKEWGIRFLSNSSNKVTIEMSDWKNWTTSSEAFILPSNYLQFKVETYPNFSGDWKTKLNTTYMNVESETDIKNVHSVSFKVQKGKETYSKIPREFTQYVTTQKNTLIRLQFFSPHIEMYNDSISDILDSVNLSTSAKSSEKFSFSSLAKSLVSPAYAQEPTTHPTPLPFQFKSIQIGDSDIMDSFQESTIFNGEPSKGYMFDAYEGQRLTVIADELNQASFLHSYLYSSTYKLLKGKLDTRIEFTAPYTGKYYVVLTNAKSEPLTFKVRVEDRNSSDIIVRIKDAQTGAELFYPPENGLGKIPFKNFSFWIDLNGKYTPEQISPTVKVQTMPGTLEEFTTKAFFPEDNSDTTIHTVVNKIDDETIAVFPTDDSGNFTTYPEKSQLVLSMSLGDNGFVRRSFTFPDLINGCLQSPGIPPVALAKGTVNVLVVPAYFPDMQTEFVNHPKREIVYKQAFNEINAYIKTQQLALIGKEELKLNFVLAQPIKMNVSFSDINESADKMVGALIGKLPPTTDLTKYDVIVMRAYTSWASNAGMNLGKVAWVVQSSNFAFPEDVTLISNGDVAAMHNYRGAMTTTLLHEVLHSLGMKDGGNAYSDVYFDGDIYDGTQPIYRNEVEDNFLEVINGKTGVFQDLSGTVPPQIGWSDENKDSITDVEQFCVYPASITTP